MKRQELGAAGEQLARHYLKKNGYRVIESNFRCRHGEIDIVTEKKGRLVFVEVRTRSSDVCGVPEESVTEIKKERLALTAQTYLATHDGLPEDWSMALVAIEAQPNGKVKRISLVENILE